MAELVVLKDNIKFDSKRNSMNKGRYGQENICNFKA